MLGIEALDCNFSTFYLDRIPQGRAVKRPEQHCPVPKLAKFHGLGDYNSQAPSSPQHPTNAHAGSFQN